jgi:cytoskeletal protein CcmA (bactofilin family)
MFNKQPTKSEASVSSFTNDLPALVENAPQRKSTAPSKVASLIAEDITLEGNLRGDGELHVDGLIRGDVVVARLSIGDGGCIEGAIHAEVVEARGRVVGSITAKQVRLFASCYVDGDITHEQLTMEAGAFFQGRSLKFQRPPATVSSVGGGDVIDLSAAS